MESFDDEADVKIGKQYVGSWLVLPARAHLV